MEDSEPVEKENAMTPIIIMIEAMIRSAVFVALMSPYPTVVIVVTVQYMPIVYMFPTLYRSNSKVSIQLSISIFSTARKIQRHEIVWMKSREKTAKKNKRSIATDTRVLVLIIKDICSFDFTVLAIFRSRISLTKRPTLAPFKKDRIVVPALISLLFSNGRKNRGKMAKKSTQNHPRKYFLAILHLLVSRFRYCSPIRSFFP